MNVSGKPQRTIWVKPDDSKIIQIIDQRFLPHQFVIEDISTSDQMLTAIKDMHVRGAPLIGVAASYGMYLAALEASQKDDFDLSFMEAVKKFKTARPTAINLAWAIQHQQEMLKKAESPKEKVKAAFETAQQMADMDVEICRQIGEFGLRLIEVVAKRKKGKPVNILTHCNAGWLACVDWGTATSTIYQAHAQGIPLHVWVDETRPRNQGASLTAWELGEAGISHTVIVDNMGGHLMQHGKVDMVIVGTDRTTRKGDVANKIGTYLKALAAYDNHIPFYVAAPSSSIDWDLRDGVHDIPIEERNADEVRYVEGLANGKRQKVLITPEKSPALNYGFDVTPSRLITALITERGICLPDEDSLSHLFPEKLNAQPTARDEGVIKFQCEWVQAGPLSKNELKPINDWRNDLYQMGLIGQYADGIGFGNLSIRAKLPGQFIISGTQTGGLPSLTEHHYTLVATYDITQNKVVCHGPIRASSEAMTHAMIYELDFAIKAVIHVHDKILWRELMFRVPTTGKDIPYGTPEMAREVRRLYNETDLREKKILVMAGHEEGVMTFGSSLEDAANCLYTYLRRFQV